MAKERLSKTMFRWLAYWIANHLYYQWKSAFFRVSFDWCQNESELAQQLARAKN
jgi:hypothetical protein